MIELGHMKLQYFEMRENDGHSWNISRLLLMTVASTVTTTDATKVVATVATPVGEISQPVKTQFGYHLIHRTG